MHLHLPKQALGNRVTQLWPAGTVQTLGKRIDLSQMAAPSAFPAIHPDQVVEDILVATLQKSASERQSRSRGRSRSTPRETPRKRLKVGKRLNRQNALVTGRPCIGQCGGREFRYVWHSEQKAGRHTKVIFEIAREMRELFVTKIVSDFLNGSTLQKPAVSLA
jgi:hypothetical protein